MLFGREGMAVAECVPQRPAHDPMALVSVPLLDLGHPSRPRLLDCRMRPLGLLE
jgi:hypothetical protein